MAHYIARIELRGNPPLTEYDKLHALMAKENFRQTISTPGQILKGTPSALPHATYSGDSTLGPVGLRELLTKVSKQVQKDVIVFVVEFEGYRSWSLGS